MIEIIGAVDGYHAIQELPFVALQKKLMKRTLLELLFMIMFFGVLFITGYLLTSALLKLF